MKFKFMFCFAVSACIMFGSCNNSAHNDAVKQANAIQEAVKANSPGAIATSDNGAYMKAKIDGRDWSARGIIPDFDSGSSYQHVVGEKGEDGISFQLWKQGIVVGKKIPFGEDHAVDFTLEGVSGFMSGKSGEAVVTNFDDQWLEGTFFFTATSRSSDKKIEVTDGRFRIPRVPGAK